MVFRLSCALFAVLVLLQGCRLVATHIDEPVTSRMLKAVAGDRFVFHLEENSDEAYFWQAVSDDERVETVMGSRRDEKGKRLKTIEIRVLAGFDGKALVELKDRHAKSDAVARHINIGLYSRTGNYAPWK